MEITRQEFKFRAFENSATGRSILGLACASLFFLLVTIGAAAYYSTHKHYALSDAVVSASMVGLIAAFAGFIFGFSLKKFPEGIRRLNTWPSVSAQVEYREKRLKQLANKISKIDRKIEALEEKRAKLTQEEKEINYFRA